MSYRQTSLKGIITVAIILGSSSAHAYPPAVGILGKSPACTTCHVSNGPWTDETRTIIDIVDGITKQSLGSEDGSFLIEVHRGDTRTILTVIGCVKECAPPLRNAWLYVDPEQIATSGLSKFAPGWDVNLPMACRIVGDKLDVYPDAHITVLPMTVRPMDAARNAALELQVMLTRGESVKGKAKEGLVSNYFVRTVNLKVVD
jgi:hypothetical protein